MWFAGEGGGEVSKDVVGNSSFTVQNLKAPQNQAIVSLKVFFLVQGAMKVRTDLQEGRVLHNHFSQFVPGNQHLKP